MFIINGSQFFLEDTWCFPFISRYGDRQHRPFWVPQKAWSRRELDRLVWWRQEPCGRTSRGAPHFFLIVCFYQLFKLVIYKGETEFRFRSFKTQSLRLTPAIIYYSRSSFPAYTFAKSYQCLDLFLSYVLIIKTKPHFSTLASRNFISKRLTQIPSIAIGKQSQHRHVSRHLGDDGLFGHAHHGVRPSHVLRPDYRPHVEAALEADLQFVPAKRIFSKGKTNVRPFSTKIFKYFFIESF